MLPSGVCVYVCVVGGGGRVSIALLWLLYEDIGMYTRNM